AFAFAIIHSADGEFISVGMLLARKNLRDDNILEFAGLLLDAFDFDTQHRQSFAEFFRGPIEIHVILQPIKSYFHRNSLCALSCISTPISSNPAQRTAILR